MYKIVINWVKNKKKILSKNLGLKGLKIKIEK